MTATMNENWASWREKNQDDPYGRRIFEYAEAWATAMESAMDAGAELEAVAEALAKEADYDGITGFMYGAAVATLAKCWKHGEQLRRWHNLDTQIGKEGEAANAKGTVLNPALLSIGK